MSRSMWKGVVPAITTPFTAEGTVDHAFLAKHAGMMIDAGCRGIVALGSLGEGGSLDPDEKRAVLRTLVEAVGSRAPVMSGVGELSTRAAVRLAQDAEKIGCKGLMVLPPYVYKGDWRETRGHFSAVIGGTGLSCLLYNNPIAYGTDILPEQAAELASAHANLHAVKESSADARRVTAVRHATGGTIEVLVGVDDMIVEGVAAGATGWVAGLVNAFPKESVRLLELALAGKAAEADALYRWFLPLLRMDVVPEFVHLIKLVQQEVGMGSERVRPPRLPLVGEARAKAERAIRAAVASRPEV